jgi:hypothetical protein
MTMDMREIATTATQTFSLPSVSLNVWMEKQARDKSSESFHSSFLIATIDPPFIMETMRG